MGIWNKLKFWGKSSVTLPPIKPHGFSDDPSHLAGGVTEDPVEAIVARDLSGGGGGGGGGSEFRVSAAAAARNDRRLQRLLAIKSPPPWVLAEIKELRKGD